MKKTLLILIILINSLSAKSQELLVEIKSDTTPLPFVELSLINQTNTDTLLAQTDFNGIALFKDISPSVYNLRAYFPQYQFDDINSIKIKDSSQYNIKLNSTQCD